jgi:hypothetical protein
MIFKRELTTAEGMPTTEELPCQNCDKLVSVILPFYGCVFCQDCSENNIAFTAAGKEFG